MPWKVQQYSTTAGAQGLASSEQAGRAADGEGRGGGRWYSWRVISNRRWSVDSDFIHTWCWWHTFCFLAGFNSIYPLEKNDPDLVWVVSNSFSHHKILSSTGLHSEQLLQPLCTLLRSGPLPQKLTVPPPTKKTPLHFLLCESLWFFSYFFLLSLFIFTLDLQFRSSLVSSTFAFLKALNLSVRM